MILGMPVVSVGAAQPNGPTAENALVPLEAYFQAPAFQSVKLSPSGRHLAFTTSRNSKRVSLVVVDLSSGFRRSLAARFEDIDVASFEWMSDDRLLFSLADLRAGSGIDYREGRGLYVVHRDGSDLRTVVRRSGSAPADRSDKSLAPNHLLLHVPAATQAGTQNSIVMGRFNEQGTVRPFLFDVQTGQQRDIDVGDAPSPARKWIFNRTGEPVAVSTSERDSIRHWVRDSNNRSWRKVHEGSALDVQINLLDVAADGTVYVTHPMGPRGELVLSKLDPEAGQPVSPPLLQAAGFDIDARLLHQGGQLLGVRYQTDAEDTIWYDERMKAFQEEVDKRIPGRINRINCRRCGLPDMRAVVFSYSDQDPGRYWLYDGTARSWQLISPVMEGIEPRLMAQVDFHRFKARDGREIPVWVTQRPQAAHGPKTPRPAVVMVHGGPWVRGSYWSWNPWEQFLASRGYVVISPEFRGSTGFGRDHFRAGWKQWGQAMQNDVADALKWAQAQGLASDRACIAGASYGGYAALMGLIRHPELYRCGVAWVAVTDLPLLVKGSWFVLDDVSAEARRWGIPTMVGDAEKDRDMLLAQSPVEQARQIKAPVLMGFGESDFRVPLAHGERMRKAMIEAGNPPEWVSYPDEGHTWRQTSTLLDFARRMERFLDRSLGVTGPR